jgi:hypothetical protein
MNREPGYRSIYRVCNYGGLRFSNSDFQRFGRKNIGLRMGTGADPLVPEGCRFESLPVAPGNLASGMSLDDIDQSFGGTFPRRALPEVLKVASEIADSFHVAA